MEPSNHQLRKENGLNQTSMIIFHVNQSSMGVFVDERDSSSHLVNIPNFRGPASVLVPQPIVLVARGLKCDACHAGDSFTNQRK